MAILKIRDENGNVVEVPALKGNKGDKGDKGDDYILTDMDKSEIAGLIDAVSQDEFDTTIGNINSILATVVNGGAS